ncbi:MULTISPECIES: peptidoglycan-binding domain-containing protein [Alphaproteobacteria]|uniref:Peptidoglycan-binding protein n=2 Tax=Alphaproteobacteria TaxID=28211 RepID=A0A512HFV4_9HYPH|nr:MULTISPECIES: peptidoglycan-binding protein [Alphaproteobacteria]GEO84333.1 peptidoglycan-binding protein [Ciceribacter naphthalenivorans]GLR24870.1 peptidoglycan-binding protein [Ciceribacter naphthalenivorans]GLT07726.1 peptidoglycan-binding protein [Sphingomonas psychrolutea]
MTKRKRKSPERKPAPRAVAVLLNGVGALARLVGRYPRSVGGFAAFSVAFGFVAANALWYQPGYHPSPIFSTRDVSDFNALAGVTRHAQLEPGSGAVTSFKIEREDASTPAAASQAEAEVASPAPVATPLASSAAGDVDNAGLVVAVQQELGRRGLYDGAADGVIGPRTEAAVGVFQKSVGVEANGLVSPELLDLLKLDRGVTAAVPKSRPVEDLSAGAVDPVAAAIRNANKIVVTAPVAKAPVRVTPPAAVPVSISGTAADAALVMEIQRGLANIAYTDVTVDGVAGAQTRAAIRRFERHYRLPETGEPSATVLKKLRDIGAL